MKRRLAIGLAVALSAAAPATAAEDARFLYRLSNFSGVLPFSAVQLHADRYHDEVYVGEGDLVRVFNASGMEIFEFTHDAMAFGSILDLTVDENGDILILSNCQGLPDCLSGTLLTRYNYRGKRKDGFILSGLPEALAGFGPNRVRRWDEKLIFLSTSTLMVVYTDMAGTYERHVDLGAGLDLDTRASTGAEIAGFHVDASGTMLFTIPVAFRAFRRKADGPSESWGKAGSVPGSFGLVAGIASDDQGNILVADRARGVVLVFTADLRFVREFGSRGRDEQRLRRPGALQVGTAGKLYVSQMAARGVSVFSLAPE